MNQPSETIHTYKRGYAFSIKYRDDTFPHIGRRETIDKAYEQGRLFGSKQVRLENLLTNHKLRWKYEYGNDSSKL